jgi:hypothetical protein
MPLLDHFHPPLYPRRPWESFHATWSVCLTEALNQRWLPEGYYADVQTHASALVEIDVATYQNGQPPAKEQNAANVAVASPVWAPPAAVLTMPAVFPDTFEVRVFSDKHGAALVAAIELISPGNKDRAEARRNFAIKCASYLNQGVSLILIDIVTSRTANLHQEIMQVMETEERFLLRDLASIYAVAYRPVLRNEKEEIDLWPASLAIGDKLPLLPLRLTGDVFVPVNFEETYEDACRRLRLAS